MFTTTTPRLILKPLLELDDQLGLLKFSSAARAMAILFWNQASLQAPEWAANWSRQLNSLRSARSVFGDLVAEEQYIEELESAIVESIESHDYGQAHLTQEAATYLFEQFSRDEPLICSGQAESIAGDFNQYLKKQKATEKFEALTQPQDGEILDAVDRFYLIRQWVQLYVRQARTGRSLYR